MFMLQNDNAYVGLSPPPIDESIALFVLIGSLTIVVEDLDHDGVLGMVVGDGIDNVEEDDFTYF